MGDPDRPVKPATTLVMALAAAALVVRACCTTSSWTARRDRGASAGIASLVLLTLGRAREVRLTSWAVRRQ